MNERYNLDIKVRFRTRRKLNVGGGQPIRSRADLGLKRIEVGGKKAVLIPGSTIKGVLRTSMIRVANLAGFGSASFRVEPGYLSDRDDIVTRLFGGPHRSPSKVFVEPIYLEGVEENVLAHISIDDDTGTVKEGALFTSEYLPIGIRFETYIRARGLDRSEARALLFSILEMRYGRIGRSGVVDIEIAAEESVMPDELLDDPVIKVIWEGLTA